MPYLVCPRDFDAEVGHLELKKLIDRRSSSVGNRQTMSQLE